MKDFIALDRPKTCYQCGAEINSVCHQVECLNVDHIKI